MQARRRRGRVPEQLRVVVRVRVDEAGRDAPDRRRRWSRSAVVVDLADARRTRPSRTPTSARRAGAPVPSTTVASRISRSSISPVSPSASARTSGRRRDVPGARFGRHPGTLGRSAEMGTSCMRTARLVTMAALVGITCAVAPASSVGAASGASSGADHGRQLVIGSLAPETGEFAAVAASLREPVKMAIAEINAAGGVGHGRTARLVTADEGIESQSVVERDPAPHRHGSRRRDHGPVHVDVCSRDPRHGEGLGPRLLRVEHRGAAHDRRTAALGRALLPHLTARPPPGAGSRRARPVRRAQQHRPDLHHRLGLEAARELGCPGVGGGRSRRDARVVRSHRRDACGPRSSVCSTSSRTRSW